MNTYELITKLQSELQNEADNQKNGIHFLVAIQVTLQALKALKIFY